MFCARNLTVAMRKCLSLRGVYLQGVKMQDTNLSGAKLQDSVFTETFDAISAVAINPNGQYWAAASRRGEVRLWEAAGQTLQVVWQTHTDSVPALAFSPDGRRLSSGSWDTTVKLWDVESGTLSYPKKVTGLVRGERSKRVTPA
jgi:WD40 repeat protein